MTDMDKEQRVRMRAHEIWERHGRPDGRHDEHWQQAEREIEMEDEDASGLRETLTETIGLAVGLEPDAPATEAPGKRRASARTEATPRPKKAKPI